ncbi:MAG: SemiSWEET family sugar transporter [Flavobacteriaceae bacterium]
MDIEIIGYVAAVLTTSSFLPQVIKVWKSKSSEGVSVTMYMVMLTGVILWGIYGFFIGSKSVLLANFVAGILQLMILIIVFRNKRKNTS